jgi:hypothetical protein
LPAWNGNPLFRRIKETTMLAKKTILAAAALAALTAAGLGSASAQPFRDYGRDHGRVVVRYDVRHDWRDHRAFVPRHRVYDTLRLHRFVGIGNPYFLRGQYVVRSHDRFGRVVLVRIDPYTGRFLGVVRI